MMVIIREMGIDSANTYSHCIITTTKAVLTGKLIEVNRGYYENRTGLRKIEAMKWQSQQQKGPFLKDTEK